MARHKNKLVRRLYKGREDELQDKSASELNEEAVRDLRKQKKAWQKGITFKCVKCGNDVSLWVNRDHVPIYDNPDFAKYFTCMPCRKGKPLAAILLEQGVEPWWKYNKKRIEKMILKKIIIKKI